MIPYIKIDGIIQFKSKTDLAPVVRPFYQTAALPLRLFFQQFGFQSRQNAFNRQCMLLLAQNV